MTRSQRIAALLGAGLALTGALVGPEKYAAYRERREARELWECKQVPGDYTAIYGCLVHRYGWNTQRAETEALIAALRR